MRESPNERELAYDKQRQKFLNELQKCASTFHWEDDPRIGLRAYSVELRGCLCPLAAVLYFRTGTTTDDVFRDTDKEYGAASLDIALSADPERKDTVLGRKMRRLVGIKPP